MNLANKTFRNNKTGEAVKVIDAFENIAILENKQKIDVRTLMDPNQFTEQIDPSSFFNNQNAYNALAEKIKTIPVDNIVDESITPKFGGEVQPAINESAIIQTTEEDEMAELARKYGVNTNTEDAVSKQNEAFQKLLNPEETPVTRVEVNNNPQVEVTREYVQPVQQKLEDPIITMFKNVKRNVNFNISIELSNKIPRLDFIEMMEDSYETSIIDFLSDEFTNQILNDPSQIKETIKREINRLVYGSESKEKVDEVSQKINEENKEEVEKNTKSKQTVKERVELISKLNSIPNIEFQLKGETSKTVISAANKRIKELKNK
jgi:hypothetical protein